MEESQEQQQPKRTLKDVFLAKRKAFSKEIYDSVQLLEDLRSLPKVQVTFFSLRQRVLEENHILMEHFIDKKKTFRERKGEEWIDASTKSQKFYNSTEKATIVDGRTALLKEAMELIEGQIAFYSDTIKTIDAVLFGLKTRIDMQKMLEGH